MHPRSRTKLSSSIGSFWFFSDQSHKTDLEEGSEPGERELNSWLAGATKNLRRRILKREKLGLILI